MKILAISGSLRPDSTTTRLLNNFKTLAPGDVSITLFQGIDALPHFSPEHDTDNTFPPVLHLRTALAEADGVIIATPEYAFNMPGSLKNALDWVVSSGEFDRKPVAAIASSPSEWGGRKALNSLLMTLSALGADVPETRTLPVTFVRSKIDQTGRLTDTETIEQFQNILQSLTDTIRAIQAGR